MIWTPLQIIKNKFKTEVYWINSLGGCINLYKLDDKANFILKPEVMSTNILLWSHAHCVYTLSPMVDGEYLYISATLTTFFSLNSFFFYGGHNRVQWIIIPVLRYVYMSHYQQSLLPVILDRDLKPGLYLDEVYVMFSVKLM